MLLKHFVEFLLGIGIIDDLNMYTATSRLFYIFTQQ